MQRLQLPQEAETETSEIVCGCCSAPWRISDGRLQLPECGVRYMPAVSAVAVAHATALPCPGPRAGSR
jgi:hypothetical protein